MRGPLVADEFPPPRPPAKKDRVKWCKGITGREHDVVLAVPPNHPGYAGVCRPAPDWYRRSRAFRNAPVPWWCYHVHMCSACGRHRRSARSTECPDRPSLEA